MALYFVSYDLRKERDYDDMYELLETLDAKKVLESTYCFNSDRTSIELRDQFKQCIDADDGVCVTKVTSWATYGTHNTPEDLQ